MQTSTSFSIIISFRLLGHPIITIPVCRATTYKVSRHLHSLPRVSVVSS